MALEKTVINVEGMSCDHCRMSVEKALKTLNGVQSATVDLETKTATVIYDPGQISTADFKLAVTQAGYEVVG